MIISYWVNGRRRPNSTLVDSLRRLCTLLTALLQLAYLGEPIGLHYSFYPGASPGYALVHVLINRSSARSRVEKFETIIYAILSFNGSVQYTYRPQHIWPHPLAAVTLLTQWHSTCINKH